MSEITDDVLFADYCEVEGKNWPRGWRICDRNSAYSVDWKDLLFAREADAKLAIKALNDAGITHGSHMDGIPDSHWAQIALSGRQW